MKRLKKVLVGVALKHAELFSRVVENTGEHLFVVVLLSVAHARAGAGSK